MPLDAIRLQRAENVETGPVVPQANPLSLLLMRTIQIDAKTPAIHLIYLTDFLAQAVVIRH